MEQVKAYLNSGAEISEADRKSLEAVVAADGNYKAAFESIKGETAYKNAFLFGKSMDSKIRKIKSGAGLGKTRVAKTSKVTIMEAADAAEDKNIKKTLELIADAGYGDIGSLNGVAASSLTEIKGIGAKKAEALAAYVAEKYGVTMS